MRCDELDPVIEAMADGDVEPDAEMRAHLQSCGRCAARLDAARAIERLLAMRPVPQPPAAFTAAVMARIGQEQWRTERAVDLGFNLAMAAGVLVIIAGGAGLAWALGLVTVAIDRDIWERVLTTVVAERTIGQVQTVAMAALMLTTALGLWWWAEADSM